MKKHNVDVHALNALLDGDVAAPVADALQPAEATVTRQVTPAKPAKPDAVPSAELVNLSFKVPPAFRKQFKTAAVAADLSQVNLLAEAFAAWSKSRKQ